MADPDVELKRRRIVRSFTTPSSLQQWLNDLPVCYEVKGLATQDGFLVVIVEKS